MELEILEVLGGGDIPVVDPKRMCCLVLVRYREGAAQRECLLELDLRDGKPVQFVVPDDAARAAILTPSPEANAFLEAQCFEDHEVIAMARNRAGWPSPINGGGVMGVAPTFSPADVGMRWDPIEGKWVRPN